MTAPHARDIPFDVLALICDNLSYSEDDNGSRATLSRLMRCSWACMEAAMPALYRQLVIRETTFHKLVIGIPLGDTTADPHSDNVARERKLRCLSSARTLVIDCWPVEWAKMVKRLRASLFPAVTSVTFTPTAFLEGVAKALVISHHWKHYCLASDPNEYASHTRRLAKSTHSAPTWTAVYAPPYLHRWDCPRG